MRDTLMHLIGFGVLTGLLSGFSWAFAQLGSKEHALVTALMALLTAVVTGLHGYLWLEEREWLREQQERLSHD